MATNKENGESSFEDMKPQMLIQSHDDGSGATLPADGIQDPGHEVLYVPVVSQFEGTESEVCVVQEDTTDTDGVVTQTLHYTHAPTTSVYDNDNLLPSSDNTCELIAAAGSASEASTSGAATSSSSAQIEIELPPDTPLCMICADKGTGYHYSVFSCEGCKGFFKRSVQKSLNYVCKESRNCVVNRVTRNNCQYCRFKKCLEAGMKREAVRDDRAPGGKQKAKKLRLDDDSTIMSSIFNNVVLDAYDDQMIQALIDAKPDLVPSAEGADIKTDSNGLAMDVDINDLMQYGYMELRLIIEWARKVPGFGDLLIEDQMALLKGSFMELNVLRLSYRSLDCENAVRFAQGLTMSRESSSNMGWGADLLNCSIEFISKLKEIAMDQVEFCIINAIVLTYPDAVGVKDRQSVISLQNKILDCFRKYAARTYRNEPHRYARILLRLPALRTVSAIAAERFLSMSLEGNIKMNALVLEMMS